MRWIAGLFIVMVVLTWYVFKPKETPVHQASVRTEAPKRQLPSSACPLPEKSTLKPEAFPNAPGSMFPPYRFSLGGHTFVRAPNLDFGHYWGYRCEKCGMNRWEPKD